MTDPQLQLELSTYRIKSSFSGPSSPEDSVLSPHTLQPERRVFPSAHWYSSPHTLKISTQGPVNLPIMVRLSLTTAAFLALLLAGFTLMVLAYNSALHSPTILRNDHSREPGYNHSALVVSKSASTVHTRDTSPRRPNILSGSGMLFLLYRDNLSDSLQRSERGPLLSDGKDSAHANSTREETTRCENRDCSLKPYRGGYTDEMGERLH